MTVQIYTCSNHALRTLIGCKGVVPMATSCCLLSSSVITDMALNIYYGIYFTVLWNLTNSCLENKMATSPIQITFYTFYNIYLKCYEREANHSNYACIKS